MTYKVVVVVLCWIAGVSLVPCDGFAGPSTRTSSTSRVAFSSAPPASRNSFLCGTVVESESDEGKKLSIDTVAELIDTTFVNACMQLAKG